MDGQRPGGRRPPSCRGGPGLRETRPCAAGQAGRDAQRREKERAGGNIGSTRGQRPRGSQNTTFMVPKKDLGIMGSPSR